MSEYKTPYVIAEVGCNHMGDMDIAHDFIKIAAIYCKIDAVKFQKRCNRELLSPEQYNAPHPNPKNSYGATYGEHREFLEFSLEQHQQLRDWCEEFGVVYSASVWDLTSAREITSLNPKYIKIPSACNNHYAMLDWICDNFKGEIHISLGMTNRREERELIDFFIKRRRNKELTIYACTSGYPVECEDLCLLEIERLRDDYGSFVKEVGFSGHHIGISADIAAYTLGANVFERHFTLDWAWKGTDHAASLKPDGLRKLKRDLINTQKALTYKREEILPVEKPQRDKLKFGERKHI